MKQITPVKQHGVFYTPENIVNYVLDQVLPRQQLDDLRILDPSAGNGSFLIPAALRLSEMTGKPLQHVVADNIYAIDIDNQALSQLEQRLKSLCSVIPNKFNLLNMNSIDYNNILAIGRQSYDIVIGNPPYVRIQNISKEEREFLKGWKYTSGDSDLFVAFIELAIEVLKPGGTLGYIIPSSWAKNKSTNNLVKWLLSERYVVEAADFMDYQIFPDADTYTGILICKKQKNKQLTLRFPKDCFPTDLHKDLTTDTKTYPLNRSTLTVRNSEVAFIEACERQQYRLGSHTRISVGLATLSDSVFFISRYVDRGDYIEFESGPKSWQLERQALRPCAKVSKLHSGDDLANSGMVIFPYHILEKKVYPWSEDHLQSLPLTQRYLVAHKERLLSRDRGKKVSYEWFHYGRSQGLTTLLGRKLLMPPMAKRPRFFLCEQNDLLFLSGYAIFEKTPNLDLQTLSKVLHSDVFTRYLHLTGKNFRDGWKGCSKHSIQEFSIPHFSDKEKSDLLQMSKEEADSFLRAKYEV